MQFVVLFENRLSYLLHVDIFYTNDQIVTITRININNFQNIKK